jgi:anti-sigma factor RsiW
MGECSDIRNQLSAWIDGELDAAGRARVDAHLASCERCRGLARDLTGVRDAARRLGPLTPPDHVWLEVAGQIRLTHPRPATVAPRLRSRPALVQWLGLAAALILLTLGAYVFTRLVPAPEAPGNAPREASVETVTEELRLALQHYEKAIAELEALVRDGNQSLDPEVAASLQRNIALLDQVAAESRSALTKEPASVPARESLFEALRRKVSVLQSTVLLMNEMRQGDAAGAARAAEALRKSS